jgi:hypothetical protein
MESHYPLFTDKFLLIYELCCTASILLGDHQFLDVFVNIARNDTARCQV